jgi:hypothetical protein
MAEGERPCTCAPAAVDLLIGGRMLDRHGRRLTHHSITASPTIDVTAASHAPTDRRARDDLVGQVRGISPHSDDERGAYTRMIAFKLMCSYAGNRPDSWGDSGRY